MVDEIENVKIGSLTPESRNVNLLVKVLDVGEPKDIETRYGTKHLAEATIADDSASMLMTLWEDQVDQVQEGDVLEIENAYISLVRGSMRLNLGRYGKMRKVDLDIDVSTEPNVSDQLHDRPRRDRYSQGKTRGKGYGKWV
ncbi:single-stranded DNA-binding protein [Methanosarcinales archaeon]|nr:MAG: single-stranded DNA-binding protein [Methanosarcinales archaeon]